MKTIWLLCVTLFAVDHILGTSSASFDNFYFCFKNKCYFKYIKRVHHENITDVCKEVFGVPISIHSREENDFIRRLIWAEEYYWLGMTVNSKGDDVWIDGSPMDYKNFKHYDPEPGYGRIDGSGDWTRYSTYGENVLCQFDVTINGTKITPKNPRVKIDETNAAIAWINGTICENEWLYFNQSCYWFNEEKVNRVVNQLNCQKRNSSMVSVHSKNTMAMLASGPSLLDSTIETIFKFWLNGERDLSKEVGFVWLDKTEVDYDYINGEIPFETKAMRLYARNDGWSFATDDWKCAQICSKSLQHSSAAAKTTLFAPLFLLSRLLITFVTVF